MNAPAQILSPTAIDHAIQVLETRAEVRAYLEYEHQFEHLADAVDPLQECAERSGLVAAIGRGAVQAIIAAPFARYRAIVAAEIEADQPQPAPDLPSDYAVQLVKRWELDDPRDRWKHTGELPPPSEKEAAPRPRPVPQSTVDAFNYVVGLGDAAYLRKWLRDHSDAAHALVNEVT